MASTVYENGIDRFRKGNQLHRTAINDLIINGCVIEVFEAPVIINPLSVSIKKSGKKRLTLDLRHVNQFFINADLGVKICLLRKRF